MQHLLEIGHTFEHNGQFEWNMNKFWLSESKESCLNTM